MRVNSIDAAVTYAPLKSEVRKFKRPEIQSDSAILRIEAAGVCGSDIGAHQQETVARILGHENVGVIDEIGEVASQKWGVSEGDRVVVEEYLPCGFCDLCRTTQFRFCKQTDSRGGGVRYGSTGIDVSPSLWGGYARYMYLHPRSILHKVSSGVSSELLTLSLPIGNGYEWAYLEGGAGPGQVVVVFGPGQQGLASVYAAKAAGADQVILFGLSTDDHRLEVGKSLGADHTADSSRVDPVHFVREVTGGRDVDLVIDTAVGNTATISAGVEMLRQCGQLLLTTAPDVVNGIPMRAAQWKTISIRGVRGHSFAAVEWAMAQIDSDRARISKMCTHSFGIDQVDIAILATAGRTDHKAVHVSVLPELS